MHLFLVVSYTKYRFSRGTLTSMNTKTAKKDSRKTRIVLFMDLRTTINVT